jgi:hypothetical protein
MKRLQDYTCLRRYIGICGKGCAEDSQNLFCPNYYPCHVIAGNAIIESPAQARILQGRLMELVERQRQSTEPDLGTVASADVSVAHN